MLSLWPAGRQVLMMSRSKVHFRNGQVWHLHIIRDARQNTTSGLNLLWCQQSRQPHDRSLLELVQARAQPLCSLMPSEEVVARRSIASAMRFICHPIHEAQPVPLMISFLHNSMGFLLLYVGICPAQGSLWPLVHGNTRDSEDY